MKRLIPVLLCIALLPITSFAEQSDAQDFAVESAVEIQDITVETPDETDVETAEPVVPFSKLFEAFTDKSDPDIASLSALGDYDTDVLAHKKNVFYYPGYYHYPPDEESDYRTKEAKVYPGLIFKVSTFVNPNYVSYYLDKNSLQTIMGEDWYIVPASVGGSYGALYYRKGADGNWE